VEHEGHHNPEQLPVVQKKFYIDAGEFDEQFGGGSVVLEEMSGFFIELLDIAEKNMGVDFFLAVEIEVDGAFAEFGSFRDVIDSDILEAFFEKQLPGGAEDRASSLFLFPSPSLR
jgi:hypothetical protein